MIPNSAPMAAVYHRLGAAGSRDGKLFSLPIVAWSSTGAGMVVFGGVCPEPADSARSGVRFIGLWQRGWSPSYDEMASLLPEHTPGTPHPLATPVVVRESQSGWTAYRTENNSRLAGRPTLDELTALLGSVGNFHIEKIVTADEE